MYQLGIPQMTTLVTTEVSIYVIGVRQIDADLV